MATSGSKIGAAWASTFPVAATAVDAEHLTFRSLRKAVAAAVSDTAGVEVARDLLGHSSTDITEGHYAKRPDLIVEVAADALDEAFAGIDA